MSDNHYPSVDIEFLRKMLTATEKVIDIIETGSVTAYILEGTSFIGKRTITLRNTPDGQVDLMKATGVALKAGCLSILMKWLEDNRNWKDGGYTE